MKPPQPNYFFSGASTNLLQHLNELATLIDNLHARNGGIEPSRITTDWRDDGEEPFEHNGWMSTIEWPIVAVAK